MQLTEYKMEHKSTSCPCTICIKDETCTNYKDCKVCCSWFKSKWREARYVAGITDSLTISVTLKKEGEENGTAD